MTMTVGELKKLLESYGVDDELRMVVHYTGGIAGSAIPVKSVYPGFDWNHGQLVIVPEEPMTIHKWYKELKDMFRSAESKRAWPWMDKIRDAHPKTGCFTNGERTCEICKLLKYIDALRVQVKKAKA